MKCDRRGEPALRRNDGLPYRHKGDEGPKPKWQPEIAVFGTRRGLLFRGGANRGFAEHLRAAASPTGVPSKKSGFCVPKRRTAFAKVKSRKSSFVINPSSTSSQASGNTIRMSG